MFRERPLLAASLIGLATAVALSQHWLEGRRPAPVDERAAVEFRVTNPLDAGAGSLREALFEAARASQRPRIRIEIPRIEISTPLPPLVHPEGLILEAATQAVLDAKALPGGTVLELRASRSVLRNLSIENAREVGIAVIASDVVIEAVTVSNADIGLAVLGDSVRVEVRRSDFRDNRLGVQVASRAGCTLHDNRFAQHRESAVWAVQAATRESAAQAPLKIVDNHFRGGRHALVIANFPAIVERNEFVGFMDSAVAILGGSAQLTGNRIRDSRNVGVFVDVTEHVVIADNEIDGNRAIGVLVRSSSGTIVERNRLHRNGYGIVTVFGRDTSPVVIADNYIAAQRIDGLVIIGSSPIVRRNRSLNNKGVGIRVLDFAALLRPRIAARPYLEENFTGGNAVDGPLRGEYVEKL